MSKNIILLELNQLINQFQADNYLIIPKSEFNDFEPRLKSAKTRFQLRAGLSLETLNTILSGTNQI